MRGNPRPERAERVVAFCPGPLPVGSLQVTGSDVVCDGVAEDHLRHTRHRYFLADAPDHECELTLEAQLTTRGGVDDRLTRPNHGRVRLEESERGLRHFVAHFGCVRGIVATDSDNLASWDHRCQQPNTVELPTIPCHLHRHSY